MIQASYPLRPGRLSMLVLGFIAVLVLGAGVGFVLWQRGLFSTNPNGNNNGDPETPHPIPTVKAARSIEFTGVAAGLNFYPKGDRLVAIGDDGSLYIWQTKQSKLPILVPYDLNFPSDYLRMQWLQKMNGWSMLPRVLTSTVSGTPAALPLALTNPWQIKDDAASKPLTTRFPPRFRIVSTHKGPRILVSRGGSFQFPFQRPTYEAARKSNYASLKRAAYWFQIDLVELDAKEGNTIRAVCALTDERAGHFITLGMSVTGHRLLVVDQNNLHIYFHNNLNKLLNKKGDAPSELIANIFHLPGDPWKDKKIQTLLPDGERVLVQEKDNTLTVRSVNDGKQICTLENVTAPINFAAKSDGKQLLASQQGTKSLALWDTTTGKQLRTITDLVAPLRHIACSGDGQRFVTVDTKNNIVAWSAETGKRQSRLAAPKSTPTALTISHDGRLVATAGKGITIWKLKV